MMLYRTDDNAGVPPLILIGVIVIVIALVSVVLLLPYVNRADDYANNPNKPPAGVDDDTPPKWQGKFHITAKISGGKNWKQDWEINDVELMQGAMELKRWSGDPWGAMLFPQWFTEGRNKYEVKYTLKITMGKTSYKDEGKFYVYKDSGYQNFGTSRWFFFWEEQEGTWSWEATVKAGDHSHDSSGTFKVN